MKANFVLAATVFGLGLTAQGQMGGRLAVSDTWIDFDEVEIDDSDSQSVTLENEGDSPLEIQDIDLDGDSGAFSFDHNCPDLLNPGDTCDVDVTFEPEEYGRFRGEIEITTSVGTEEVQLEGRGVFED